MIIHICVVVIFFCLFKQNRFYARSLLAFIYQYIPTLFSKHLSPSPPKGLKGSYCRIPLSIDPKLILGQGLRPACFLFPCRLVAYIEYGFFPLYGNSGHVENNYFVLFLCVCTYYTPTHFCKHPFLSPPRGLKPISLRESTQR